MRSVMESPGPFELLTSWTRPVRPSGGSFQNELETAASPIPKSCM